MFGLDELNARFDDDIVVVTRETGQKNRFRVD